MSEALDELLALERRFWTEGSAFYQANVDCECLVASPDLAEIFNPASIAARVMDDLRWTDVTIDLKGLIQPTPDMVVICYDATARRDGEPYAARVTSGYVWRDLDWKLSFHHHMPTPDRLTAATDQPRR